MLADRLHRTRPVSLCVLSIARDWYVNVIFSASASYCHVFDVFFQTILHNKKARKRIARQRTKKRTATAYTSFLTGCSPRPTVENFSKGTCGRNDRSTIILTKETTKLSALLTTSTHHMCVRRSLNHEPTCVGHKSKRKGRSLATCCGKQ